MRGLPYYGGKARLASRIVNLLPPHTVYVEPFVGGGSVLFAKGVSPVTNTSYYREVINDKDERLINLYRHLRDDPDLVRLLQLTPYSRSDYRRSVVCEDLIGIESAWSMFVSLCMAFSNKVDCKRINGMSIAVSGTNHQSTWRNRVDQIQLLVDRLRKVAIECDDAISVIERWDSPQTLFYCDPPYPGADQGYKYKHILSDYEHLCWVLDNIQGSFVLSCYSQGIEPDYWNRVDIDAYCSASGEGIVHDSSNRSEKKKDMGDRKRTESLFIVDRSKNAREELIPYLWSPSQGFPYRDMKKEELRKQSKTDFLDQLFSDF